MPPITPIWPHSLTLPAINTSITFNFIHKHSNSQIEFKIFKLFGQTSIRSYEPPQDPKPPPFDSSRHLEANTINLESIGGVSSKLRHFETNSVQPFLRDIFEQPIKLQGKLIVYSYYWHINEQIPCLHRCLILSRLHSILLQRSLHETVKVSISHIHKHFFHSISSFKVNLLIQLIHLNLSYNFGVDGSNHLGLDSPGPRLKDVTLVTTFWTKPNITSYCFMLGILTQTHTWPSGLPVLLVTTGRGFEPRPSQHSIFWFKIINIQTHLKLYTSV
jgi:hypothetical protein